MGAITMSTPIWRFGQPTGQDATPRNFYHYAIALQQYGELDTALFYLERALAVQPTLLETYTQRGCLLAQLGNTQAGLADLQHVLQQRPDDVLAHNNRGIVYMNIATYPEALADFERAIQLAPDWGPPYYNRAYVYTRLGELDKAIAGLQQCLTLEPYRSGAIGLEARRALATLQEAVRQPNTPAGQSSASTPPRNKAASRPAPPFSRIRRWFQSR